MSVLNGQLANQTTFNNAFMSRTAATTSTVAIVALNNGVVASGPAISNTQEAINETFDAVGMTGVNDTTRNNYSSNEIVSNGDNRKEAIEKLDAEFNNSTGHAHSGAAGDGAPISAPDLADYNDFWAEYQSFNFSAAAGSTDDVSAGFVGKTPGGNATAAGVLTGAPDNFVYIVDLSTGTFLEDTGGQRIYARVTESSGVWTLTYYTNEAGVETAASITPATDIKVLYREVFRSADRPTIPSSPGEFGTLDVTADVVDANTSQAGKLAVGAQNIPTGVKTFTDTTASTDKDTGAVVIQGGLGVESRINAGGRIAGAGLDSTAGLNVSAGTARWSISDDSSSTGTSANVPAPSTFALSLSNASLASIGKITSPLANQLIILINKTGSSFDILNQDTNSEHILTGTGNDLPVEDDASVWLTYDSAASRWRVIGGSGGGSGTAFQEIPAGTVNGVNTSFGPLTYLPTNDESVMVFVDGIALLDSEFSVTGANISLSVAPALGQSIYAYYLTGGSSALPTFTGIWKTEYRTISGGEATAKQLTLTGTPASVTEVLLDVIGGGAQFYGDDFTVSGTTLSWSGLGLDGVLSSGDRVRIGYVT